MDEISTPKIEITEKLIQDAMSVESCPKVSDAALEFIRNFAANFRVCKGVEGRAQDLLLS